MIEPTKYRKKPLVIEAMRVTRSSAEQVVLWITHSGEIASEVFHVVNNRTVGVDIETPEGLVSASLGDYVVRGIRGEFYPVKPDIFEATYDPVEPENENAHDQDLKCQTCGHPEGIEECQCAE